MKFIKTAKYQKLSGGFQEAYPNLGYTPEMTELQKEIDLAKKEFERTGNEVSLLNKEKSTFEERMNEAKYYYKEANDNYVALRRKMNDMDNHEYENNEDYRNLHSNTYKQYNNDRGVGNINPETGGVE